MNNNGIDIDRLFRDGEFLTDTVYYRQRVCLYHLDTSLIEVYYDVESNSISYVGKASYGDLNKFLTKFNVS